ncbi:MAG: CzcE family metal-binding protein [Lysobacteraceae bacterium]|nr:MAG: CzcE family metal-binding protein [Xanthomonadaceae bacterium]
MTTRTTTHCLAAILLSVTAVSHAEDIPQPYGVAAPAESAQRDIRIGPMTRYVNVERAEIVRFVTDKGSFAWSFDTAPNRQVFSFKQIAPVEQQAQEVRVYIADSARDR